MNFEGPGAGGFVMILRVPLGEMRVHEGCVRVALVKLKATYLVSVVSVNKDATQIWKKCGGE